MGLLQPTNVSPSMWGEIGSGVVDANGNMDVSWQVNGDVPMTAYQIYIYVNDALSTQKYTTGKVVLTEPFYGLDYNGNINLFSMRITRSTLIAAGITNGNNYKLKITQYWGGHSESEKVVQSSMSAFITRKAPQLAFTNVPPGSVISSQSYSFTMEYIQEQGDAINYVRWKALRYSSGNNVVFKDTGNLYGVSQLKFDCDGFLPMYSYIIYCEVQTQNGVVASISHSFLVMYNMPDFSSQITLQQLPEKSGIRLSWPLAYNVPGTGSGFSFTDDGALTTSANGYVEWNRVNGSAMKILPSWTAIIEIDSRTLSALVQGEKVRISLGNNGDHIKVIRDGLQYNVIIQWGSVYRSYSINSLSQNVVLGFSYINTTDYSIPVSIISVYALVGNTKTIEYVFNSSPGEDYISSFKLFDNLTAKKCSIMSDYYTINDMIEYVNNPRRMPIETVMMTRFADGTINAGTYGSSQIEVTGYVVYRYSENDLYMKKIAFVSHTQNSVIDCGVPSQSTVTYALFASGTSFSTDLLSEQITPVFWDWAILECTQVADKTYHPVNIFLFGKNLTSGTITNNNSPNLLQNFTRYPTIQRATQNYMSGTLQSYIGTVDTYTAQYTDTLAQRDAISNLSTTSNALFLKNRKGDIFPIQIAGAIGFTTLDGSREQALNASVPWAQVGEIGDKSIILTSNDSLFPES